VPFVDAVFEQQWEQVDTFGIIILIGTCGRTIMGSQVRRFARLIRRSPRAPLGFAVKQAVVGNVL
jgi:hypothetical protein